MHDRDLGSCSAGWVGITIAAVCFGLGLRHFERPPAALDLPELAVSEPGPVDPAPG